MKLMLEETLKEFIEANNATYYMIRHYPEYINYCTLLKVESINCLTNIVNFIWDHIGEVTSISGDKDRLDFDVSGEVYSFFSYDGGLVIV